MILMILALAAASDAWIAAPQPWGAAQILAISTDGAHSVLTADGLYVHGERDPNFQLRPATGWAFARGGHPVAADADSLCAWVEPDWVCLDAVGDYPFQHHPDWAGAQRGLLWRWNGAGWDANSSPMAASLSSHVITISGAEQPWLIPVMGDWWHLGEGGWVQVARPAVQGDAHGAEVCGDLAIFDGLWRREGAGWTMVPGAEWATACDGDLVGGRGGRLWRWREGQLREVPTTSAADVVQIGEGRVWAGRELLTHAEIGTVFRDEAVIRGVANAAPTRTAWFVDADRDGGADLLTALVGGQLVLYRTDGNTFRDATVGSGLEGMRWSDPVLDRCDLDGDGIEDLLVAESKAVRWLRGTGSGWEDVTARGVDEAHIGRTVEDIDCVDLDGDGDRDLFLTTSSGADDSFPAPNAAFVNIGHGRLRRADPALRGLGSGRGWTFRTVFTDLDGDAVDEAIAVNAWMGGPAVWRRQALGWSQWLALDATYAMSRTVLVGDWDGDGVQDLALLRDSSTVIQRGETLGFTTLPLPDIDEALQVPAPPTFEALDPGGAVDDVDGDGDLDLLTLAPGGARWLRNLGAGRFDLPPADVGLQRGAATQIAAADIDSDGDLDLFLPTLEGPNQLLVNARRGPGAAPHFPLPTPTVAAVIARRLSWLRWRESGLRLALVAGLLCWLFLRARIRDTLVLSRPVAVLAVALAALAAEVWAGESGPELRWFAGVGTLGVIALGGRGDQLLTRIRRATRLAGYQLEGILGSGGMGTVHLARDGTQQVALKVLHPELALKPEARARFRREAELASRFQHPNLVRVLAAGECRVFRGDLPQVSMYLAMEHIDGPVLSALLGAPLPVGQVCRLLVDLLGAVALLHEGGVVHRDIKPSNLLLQRDGVVKLADFGIAHGGATQTLTQTGNAIGTLAYMAPEQARGLPVDARADVYAIGAVAHELLSGRPVFDATDGVDLVYQLLTQPAPPLTEVHPGLAEAVARCLHKDPESRWPDAKALRSAIRPFADNAVDLTRLRAAIAPTEPLRAAVEAATRD